MARRALRIFPIYYLTLAVTAVIAPRDPLLLPAAVYLSNFVGALDPQPSTLVRTWSLCVEEHFYLVWPLLVYFLPRRASRLAAVAIVLIAVVSMIVTAWALRDERLWLLLKQGSIYRFGTLGIGALIAYDEGALRRSGRLRRASIGVAALLSTGFLAASFDAVAGRFIPPPYDRITLLLFLAAASAAVVLLSVGADAKQNLLNSALSLAPLRYLGRISYGLYLYHGIPLYLLWEHADGGWWWRLGWAAAVLSISVAAAALSFHYLERPILRWGNRFRLREGPPPRPLERLTGPGI